MHALVWGSIQHAVPAFVGGSPVLMAAVSGGEVAITAMVFAVGGAVVIPIARSFARRLEGRADGTGALPRDIIARLERIERSVDAMAVEVERISEGQRFVTQVMAERTRPPAIGAGPQ